MFFIIGQTRSRTAWLANFLTYDRTYCVHELSARYGDLRIMREDMEDVRSFTIGTADSSLPVRAEEFLLAWPSPPKVLVVWRDPLEIIKSYEEANGPLLLDVLEMTADGIHRIREVAQQAMTVRYDEIDDRLGEIWRFCTDDLFNPSRAEMLTRMNITVPPELAIAAAHPAALEKLERRIRG